MSLIRKDALKQLVKVFKQSKKTQPNVKVKDYPNGYVEKNALDGPIQTYEDFIKKKK
jgi:hypothetical protein